jgi:serine/threonine protein phosphatase PrpC
VNTAVRDDDTLPSDLARTLGRSVRSWAMGDTSVSSWAAASETGLQRSHNEDAWGQREGSVFVVADGMGGRPGGAVAATAAVDALLEALAGDISSRGAAVYWRQVLGRANEAVVAAGRRAGHDHVGAAVAIVHSGASGTVVAHAGDVRVYRLRGDAREAITSDHTVATELEFAGLRPDDVPDARGRLRALSSFLGDGEAWQAFSVRMLDIRRGDRLVVCSDGVHRHAAADTWRAAASTRSCQDLVDVLVTAARDARGPDDATALALRIGMVP